VNAVLASRALSGWRLQCPRELVVQVIGETLAEARSAILEGRDGGIAPGTASAKAEQLGAAVAHRLEGRFRPQLRRVVNATGVVLHTNMGRAPLAAEVVQHLQTLAAGYSNLELDLESGERGDRFAHIQDLLRSLTGAESSLVVNNNAAATLLMLAAVCRDREVVVSRGELVEIGGGFRVPDVIIQGGGRLIEVGTTNKTRLQDYEKAITQSTGALLKVHSSNFKIVGFAESPSLPELSALARRVGLPFLVDWGCGTLLDLSPIGLSEVAVNALIADGADLVSFSGDKLLGGPQAGLIVGRRDLVERCRRHPLARAFRIDKLTLAALEATLKLYLNPAQAWRRIPALRMLALRREDLRGPAEELAAAIQAAVPEASVVIQEGYSESGGGTLPGVSIPTLLVAAAVSRPAHEVEAGLRHHQPPVMARIQQGRVLFDLRTIEEAELTIVAQAMAAAARGRPHPSPVEGTTA
jgi:L-seryl-tRNA(Ser) seleniumtransferase